VFAPDRKAERPATHLQHFRGVLHVDGYAGFEPLANKGDVVLAACWSHARRRFYYRKNGVFGCDSRAPSFDVARLLLTRSSAEQETPIALFAHPFGSRQMTVKRAPRAIWFAVRIEMQHDPCDIAPFGTFSVSVK
jgi:hypothetical protein